MRYLSEVITDIAKLPAAIEKKLPANAPKISRLMTDAAAKVPTGPSFPVDIPELPEPKLPDLPGGAAAEALGLAPRPTLTRGKSNGSQAATTSNIASRGRL